MSLYFRSLCSSSSGNCLVLWSDKTRIVIDCGLSSMRKARELLECNLGNPRHVDSVIISHTHSDHINYQSLRVIDEYGLTLKVCEKCLDQLRGKHYNGYRFKSLKLETFSNKPFTVGDLYIHPFEIPHNPNCANHGFVVKCIDGMDWKTAVIATDFYNWRDVLDNYLDLDFIFTESNHDPGLLAKYFNPNSRFHMSNTKTAELLYSAYLQSKRKPHTVMLGHLSNQRNTERHALGEICKIFKENGVNLDPNLYAAPLYEPSRVIKI